LHENIQYTGKLTLFQALIFSDDDVVTEELPERADYWKSLDVSWENTISAHITKIITVNFYMEFIYDKQIALRGQLKETVGIGLVFKIT
jgi:hypothetical protein